MFYFKRRDTNFNLPQEYLDLHALHSFNAIFLVGLMPRPLEGITRKPIAAAAPTYGQLLLENLTA